MASLSLQHIGKVYDNMAFALKMAKVPKDEPLSSMSARVAADTTARYGDKIKLALNPAKIHVFDKETELTITN